MPRSLLVALVLVAAVLAGCGGGGGDDRPATIEMGSSAAAEVQLRQEREALKRLRAAGLSVH